VLSAAAARYIPGAIQASEEPNAIGEAVTVSETGQGKFQNSVQVGGNFWLFADEPETVGGLASGPSPYDFLKIGLGACTTMTLRMFAERRGIDVGQITTKVTLNRRHADDARECVDDGLDGKLDTLTREIEFGAELDAETKARLLKVAERCPVHQTLEGRAIIKTRIGED
jgi:putative redox protein